MILIWIKKDLLIDDDLGIEAAGVRRWRELKSLRMHCVPRQFIATAPSLMSGPSVFDRAGRHPRGRAEGAATLETKFT
jgi:hypothetical protein